MKILLKAVLLAVFFFYLLFFKTHAAFAAFPFERISGVDRFTTAVEVQKRLSISSGCVVLACGDNYPDALCAAPLAKKLDAALLLTAGDDLSMSTMEEIKRRAYNKVFIVGGNAAISNLAEKKLISMGLQVERIGGKDRYETSVKVAEKIYEKGMVGIVSGTGFADAVSFSSCAAALNIPILLTEKDRIPETVKNFISSKNIEKYLIIGGTASVGSSIEDELKNTERLYGKDRYETNFKIMEKFKNNINSENIYIVSGLDFPDALTSSVLACRNGGAVYLVSEYMSKEQQAAIKSKLSAVKNITVIGGSGAISDMTMYLIGLADNPPVIKPPVVKPYIPDWPEAITVINADEATPVYIKAKPSEKSSSIGYAYGELTEVKITERVGDYYHITFRTYGSNSDLSGYIYCDMLKTVKADRTYTVYVDTSKQKVSIYNSKGLVKEISCSTGMENTETTKGRFLTGSRGYYFIPKDGNCKCFYWVRFNNNYLFHSVLCDFSGNIIESEAEKIGSKASHGCIRLPFDEAKWFYDNIPKGTLVTIN